MVGKSCRFRCLRLEHWRNAGAPRYNGLEGDCLNLRKRLSLLGSLLATHFLLSAPAQATVGKDVVDLIRAWSPGAGKMEPCLKAKQSDGAIERVESYASLSLGGASAIEDVMFHGDKETNDDANHGALSYFSSSLDSDDLFFTASVRFLGELRQRDSMRHDSEYGMTPIQIQAEFDVFALAMRIAQANPYMALKLMAVYGHDNMINSLAKPSGNSCRNIFLDSLIPRQNSTLYLNGALGGVTYAEKDVREGEKIAAACSGSNFSLLERQLCNDGRKTYQGDYYHVIMSAFLHCRRQIAENAAARASRVAVFSGSLAPASTMIDATYLARVRDYKISRFREAVSSFGTKAGNPTYLLNALNHGLRLLERGIKLNLPWKDTTHLSRHELKVLNATLHRFEFEVDFRMRQHRLGMAYGKNACQRLTDFSPTPIPLCP